MTLTQIEKTERVWERYCRKDGTLMFIVTTKKNTRDLYFLYEHNDGVFTKLGKAQSPLALMKKYKVHERIKRGK